MRFAPPGGGAIRLLRVTQQNLAGLGQYNVRSSAIEKLDANIFLKRLDLEAHRGLCQIQLFSGFAEAALLGYGSENNQAKIVETRHKMIRTLSLCCSMDCQVISFCRVAAGWHQAVYRAGRAFFASVS
jgi:CTP synthase (UTP-ammonia lyase)